MAPVRPRSLRRLLATVTVIALVSGLVMVSASVVASRQASAAAAGQSITPQFAGSPYFAPGQVYDQNFPDPDVVYDPSTDRYWAFSTGTGGVYVPAMWSTDLVTWTARTVTSLDHPNPNGEYHDALPDPSPPSQTWHLSDPRWPDSAWAPSVAKVGSRWVMFYALQVDATGRRCIAYATSAVPEGPYLDPKFMYCSQDPQGSIDPFPWTDTSTGQTLLVWKDQGLPGVYGQRSWARRITMTDATTVAWSAGSVPMFLFESSASWEIYSAENPSLVRMDDGSIGLFWSGNEWNSANYGVGFARCPELSFTWTPQCIRASEAPVMSRRQGERGIGGSSALRGRGGQLLIADHYWGENLPTSYPTNQRYLVVDRVDIVGGRMVFSHEPAPTTYASAGAYVPRAPIRMLDTRSGLGTTAVRRTEPGEVFIVDLSSLTAPSVTSVTFNLTVTDGAAAGFVTAHACGAPPDTSNLNFAANAVASSLVTVRVNDARHVCLYTNVSTNLIVDLQGQWTSSASGGLTAITPRRVLDTRPDRRLTQGATIEVQVRGLAGVPNGATAAVLGITADGASGDGFLTAWSCDGARPTVSNVNYGRSSPSGNSSIVPLSARGTVCIYSHMGADVIVDVFGYSSAIGGRLTTRVPVRLVDTRSTGERLAPGSTFAVSAVGAGAAPAGSTAVALTVTAVDAGGAGWVSVFPCADPPARGSETSVINLVAGQTRAAHVIVKVAGGGRVCVRSLESTDVIVDLVGSIG